MLVKLIQITDTEIIPTERMNTGFVPNWALQISGFDRYYCFLGM